MYNLCLDNELLLFDVKAFPKLCLLESCHVSDIADIMFNVISMNQCGHIPDLQLARRHTLL